MRHKSVLEKPLFPTFANWLAKVTLFLSACKTRIIVEFRWLVDASTILGCWYRFTGGLFIASIAMNALLLWLSSIRFLYAVDAHPALNPLALWVPVCCMIAVVLVSYFSSYIWAVSTHMRALGFPIKDQQPLWYAVGALANLLWSIFMMFCILALFKIAYWLCLATHLNLGIFVLEHPITNAFHLILSNVVYYLILLIVLETTSNTS
jgi:hypothetical protein